MCGLAIAFHVWLVVMSVAWVVDSVIVTSRRLVAVHTVSSWTPPPSSKPFRVGIVPARDGNLSTVNVSPSAGVKPLTSVTFSAPFRLTVPVLSTNWSYCVPAVAPPRSIFRAPLAVCV